MQRLGVALAVTVLLLFAHEAKACIEVSAPTTLSAPGIYCLTANINQDIPGNNAITVASAGVTLEMRGLTIFGPGTGTGVGIYVAVGAHDFTVRNGTITKFMFGLRADGSDRIRILDVDASYNHFRGFLVTGDGAWILYNRAHHISGYSGFADSYAFGIEVLGQNCVIASNEIGEMLPIRVGEGVHISLSDNNAGCSVYNNIIRQDTNSIYGSIFAIWVGQTNSGNIIRDNTIVGTLYGINAPPATIIRGNTVRTKCATYWNWRPDDYETENLEISDGCPDTIDILTRRAQEDPNRGEWWYRLGFNVRNRIGDTALAKQHYQRACGLGIHEACRAAAGIP